MPTEPFGGILSSRDVALGQAAKRFGAYSNAEMIDPGDGNLVLFGTITGPAQVNPDNPGGGDLAIARRTTTPEIILPASYPLALTANAGWVSLGSSALDFYISTFFWAGTVVGGNAMLQLELASGVAQANARDALRSIWTLFNPGPSTVFYNALWGVGRGVKIPANEEKWVRLVSNIGSPVGEFVLTGWQDAAPVFVSLPANLAPGPGRYYPNNGQVNFITTVSGAAYVYGSPAEVVAQAPGNGLLVTGLGILATIGNLQNPGLAVQVGIGPAGSETWLATAIISHESPQPCIWPPVWVQVGERLAVRTATTSGGYGAGLKIRVCDL